MAIQDKHSEFEFVHEISSSPSDDSTQEQDSDFEFGCVTPESPTNDPNKNSPADLLFFNGRLLPHAFPFQSVKNINGSRNSSSSTDYLRGSSRTSSVSSSKDSLTSSRSNSSNSRSSSCSSARTSSSENIDMKVMNSDKVALKTPMNGVRNQVNNKPALYQPYVSSQRWQFITPAPALTSSAENSRRKKPEVAVVQEESRSKKEGKDKSSWFGQRIFRSFVSACRECHALQPSMKKDDLQGNVNLQ